MKKFDFGQTVSLLANLGVIAGIVFLAVELQQNNRLLSAEAQFNYLQLRLEGRLDAIYDADVAEFQVRVESGDELSEVDRYRNRMNVETTMLGLEYEYGQVADGNLPYTREDLKAKWRGGFRDGLLAPNGPWREEYDAIWPQFRLSFNDEFLKFWEQEIMRPE